MLTYFLTGLPVIVACLLLQSLFVSYALRYYVSFRAKHAHSKSTFADMWMLTMVMLLTLLGNSVQVSIWAALLGRKSISCINRCKR